MAEVVRSTIQKRDDKGVIRHGAEWLTLWSDPDSLKTDAEKRSDVVARRTQVEVERRLAAAARSISGDPDLHVAFGSHDTQDLPALRGHIDSYALIRRFHSKELHQRLAPKEPAERRLFDLCEYIRCEALGALRFCGVRENLVAAHLERLRKSDLLNAHLASLVPLGEGLRMVLRDALLEEREPSIGASAFWMWDQWIRARFSDGLAALRRALNHQSAYASAAIKLIRGLLIELGSDQGQERRFQPTTDRGGSESDDEMAHDKLAEERWREDPAGDRFQPGGNLFLDDAPGFFEAATNAPIEPSAYSVFTTAHDQIALARDLVDIATLRQARAGLDQRRADFRRDFARLVMKLQRRLLARQTRNWTFDLDEGLIDASRLDRVIVNPGFASAYKAEQESDFRDSVVAILIDNSGSMRGKPIEIACLASDMLSAALERCGISCEILGFTTGGWAGGKSARDWARAGKPPNPGRLNDLLHIVYKSADEPVRRSRPYICAMLEPSLLKENIDGEALLWASRRLLLRPERRKVLIVISDGAPVDQSTLENNSDHQILDRHLREAIAAIEASHAIELTAVGVKHEVARYYRHSVQIEKVESLGASLAGLVDRFLS